MKNARMKVLSGPDQGRTFRLRKDSFVIGSDASSDLVVEDRYVAPRHAEIRRFEDGSFSVRRYGLNPVYVDRIEVLHDAPLRPGSVLAISPNVAVAFDADAAAAAPVTKSAEDGVTTLHGVRINKGQIVKLFLFLVLPIYGAFGLILWNSLHSGQDEKFEPTQESFEANVAAVLAKPECKPRESYVAPVGSTAAREFAEGTKNAVAAEGRGAWDEALRYYDRVIPLILDPNCTAVRYVAFRREKVYPKAERKGAGR